MTVNITKEEKVLVNRESINLMEKGNEVEDYED